MSVSFCSTFSTVSPFSTRHNNSNRFYQLNQKVKIWYNCENPYGYRWERVLIENECNRIKMLQNFENKNC